MDAIFIILAAVSGILFTFGDVMLKYWSDRSNIYFIIAGFAFYLVAGTFLAFAFKRREIAISVALLICFNLITIAILGFVLFKETLGLKEVLGLSFTMVAVILLTI